MIVVCTEPPEDARRLTGVLGAGKTEISVIGEPGELPAALRDAECLILGYRGRFLEEHLAEVAQLVRRFPALPVILVTGREPRVARWLSDVRLASVLWYRDVWSRLPAAILDARNHTAFARLAAEVEASETPPALKRALLLAFLRGATVPFRLVKELAEAAGCSPVTVSQQFRACVGTDATLSGLLNGLIVLRAQHLRLTGLAWETLASDHLDVSRATLHRKVRVWPGCTLSELEFLPPRDLLARFAEERLGRIIRAGT